ncbi:MAG: DUF4058 family protein [Cyanobacteria bacterium J06555_13]
MPIPFPGMNPYLEHPDLWPTFHQRFIAALADSLKSHLPATYRALVKERRYHVSGEDALVVGAPGLDWSHSVRVPQKILSDQAPPATPVSLSADVTASTLAACSLDRRPILVLVPIPQEVYETYIEIVDSDETVVTIIEALSPKKKRLGRGRDLYERQREAIFGSRAHFVEIDLLRGWEPSSIYGPDEAGDYRILVSRSEQRPRAQLFTWHVMESIPMIILPLRGTDEITVALKPMVDQACDRTDLLVNYQQPPLPPLRTEEAHWLNRFLQQVGMRPCVS